MVDQGRDYGTRAIDTAGNPANWELWPVPTDYVEAIYHRFPEFTCLCPRSGYPDFATVHLVVVPRDKVVELRDLKMFFNSFRDRRISHEGSTAEILRTLKNTLSPWYVFVFMEYSPRGNLTTYPMAQYVDTAGPAHNTVVEGWSQAMENAEHLRRTIIFDTLGRREG